MKNYRSDAEFDKIFDEVVDLVGRPPERRKTHNLEINEKTSFRLCNELLFR